MTTSVDTIAPAQGADPAAEWVLAEVPRLLSQVHPAGLPRARGTAEVAGPANLLNRVFGSGLTRTLADGQTCSTLLGLTLVHLRATMTGVPLDALRVTGPSGAFLLPIGPPGGTAESAEEYRTYRMEALERDERQRASTPPAPRPVPECHRWPEHLPHGIP